MDATEFYKNVLLLLLLLLLLCIILSRLNRLIPYLENPLKESLRIHLIKNLILNITLLHTIPISISVSHTTRLFSNNSLVITELFHKNHYHEANSNNNYLYVPKYNADDFAGN